MNAPADLPRHLRHDDDEDMNPSANPTFEAVLDARLSRRSLLRGGVGSAAAAVLGSWSVAACGGGDDDPVVPAPPAALDKVAFAAVPKSTADVLSVPAGYTATVLYALGDPLDATTPAFKNDGTDTDFDKRAGDHHDGMAYFGLSAGGGRDAASNDRGLLVMNHEALTDNFLHATGSSARPRPAAESDKEMPAHGISIVEVAKTGGVFATRKDSTFNRRITPITPMEFGGPVRGNALVKTVYSTAGTATRGTINNCGNGYSPWGTYLSGEENWSGYFTRSATDNAARGNDKSVVSLNRYGRAQGAASRHGWETSGPEDRFARWNISKVGVSADGSDDYRNEMNGYGWTVEVDPYDKAATVKKRTALGRFAHESADFGKLVPGKPLAVYMGDDSRGEYMYKFVSAAPWDAADANAANRIAAGDKYLDAGKLYVAKFNADGTGTWLELTIGAAAIATYATYAFADQADVLVNARLAADALGATKMDRPEWCAVHPTTGEIYYTLTNNSNRKVEPTGSQQGLDAANPRAYLDPENAGAALSTRENRNGHIIRIKENAGESAATAFTWDVYLFGSQANGDAALVNLSGLGADQDFSSPDGLWFSRSTRLCWIQTDDGAYTDATNCMMLAGVPGGVGDGAKATLNHPLAAGGTVAVDTYVGKKPTADTLRRFLVGPKDCEITGITETPDGKAIFVNIQHPGETIAAADVADPSKYLSHWPGNAGYGAGGATARPRSATVVITKNDGGRIGT
jgi:secreted PhoX family phosphatase